MKNLTAFLTMLLLAADMAAAQNDDLKHYYNQKAGVSFSYPDTLSMAQGSEQPLNLVFQIGTPPFAVSILFKQLSDVGNLDAFISRERAAQEAGGYRDQIKEHRHKIEGKIPAIEFIRTSELGTIYYFVFQSQKSRRLFAFWHVTSKTADPQAHAVMAYRTMIDTLKLSH